MIDILHTRRAQMPPRDNPAKPKPVPAPAAKPDTDTRTPPMPPGDRPGGGRP